MTTAKAARKGLLAYALKKPGAWVDHPWEEDVAKVGKKIFVFFGRADGPDYGVGVKLPRSLLYARAQKFVQKFGYGMDKSGWVAARFSATDHVPVELLQSWIDESYDAVAAAMPKRRGAKTKTPPARTRRPAARTRA